ncbi:MAG: hypothetical protein V4582_16225 [Pseudomonadota bacterium]
MLELSQVEAETISGGVLVMSTLPLIGKPQPDPWRKPEPDPWRYINPIDLTSIATTPIAVQFG